MIRKKVLLVILSSMFALHVFAQYPFSLPSSVTATFNINTSSQENFNNLLLGYNIHGFSTNTEKDLVRYFNPITIRFPHGLFSNWYDWEQDKARVYGAENITYIGADGSYKTKEIDRLSDIKTMDAHNLYVGIDGLEQLNSEKTNGYDMIWTFNMSADGTNFNNGSPVSVARYNDLISRGFQVKAIELGNECFYPGQRSSIIPNSTQYIKRAKSMSSALKAKDSNIKVSIPLLRRASSANPNWNEELTANESYFDAVSVHTYVGSDPDDPNSGEGAFATALTAREGLRTSIDNYAGSVVPNKPVWLSEWGVKSGGPNAVSALGMADCYIFMSQNQDRYQRANWFSVNGKLNSFLIWEDYTSATGVERQRIKYPLEKTAYGSTYEIVRSVFESSILLGGSMTCVNLMTNVDAVSARAVVKDGQTTVFVINLTNKVVPFTVKLDGANYGGSFTHKAMSFTWMGQEQTRDIDDDPLTLVKSGSGAISLPKFSVSTILLDDANVTTGNPIVHLTKANSTGYAIDGGNGGSNYQNVKLLAADQSNVNQQWEEIHVGLDYYRYKKLNTNYSLDGGNGGASGQNLRLYTSSYSNQNQQWKKISLGNGVYRLQKRNASNYSIDGGTGGANYQNVKLWVNRSSSTSNQAWIFTTVGLKNKSATVSVEDATAVLDVETEEATIKVYPNPTDGSFSIDMQSLENAQLSIYTISGSLVYQRMVSQEMVQLSKADNFKTGVYLIKVTDQDAKVFYERLIVK